MFELEVLVDILVIYIVAGHDIEPFFKLFGEVIIFSTFFKL
jgi:hypothetical protein